MNRGNKTGRIPSAVIALIVVLTAAAVGLLLWRLLRYEDELVPVKRIGDEFSDEYNWKGLYYDSGTMTTLSIESAGSGYEASISCQREDGTMLLWSFPCSYSPTAGILSYENAVCTEVVINRPEEAAGDGAGGGDMASGDGAGEGETASGDGAGGGETVSDEAAITFERRVLYEDGTGYLYLSDHVIHWVDETENFGDGMMFEKLS